MLVKCLRPIAKRSGLMFPCISDELNPKSGRTQYVGAPSSAYRVRVYDKGKEMMAKGADVDKDGYIFNSLDGKKLHVDDWVRYEMQLRPKAQIKSSIALYSPKDFIGVSPWLREAGNKIFNLNIKKVAFKQKEKSSYDKALDFMCLQYGRHLKKLFFENKGDVEKELKRRMDRIDSLKNKIV
jgi:DNA relaxase NicK